MGWELAKANGGRYEVGSDHGRKGDEHFWRVFQRVEYGGKVYLKEIKSSASFADYSRYYEVREYDSGQIVIDEPNKWEH